MTENGESARTVRILGVGNVLMGDDALGPYVVRVLEAGFDFDEAVEVLDVGTPGLDFTPYLAHARAVIVIDTVRSDAPPGTLRIYRQDDLLSTPPTPRLNPHEPGLREALMATELTDCSPGELTLVGVVPESVEAGTGLSMAVKTALDPVVEAVMTELDRLGLRPQPRTESLPPDIWWEHDSGEQPK